jgi:hypothetical protein
MAFCVSKNLKGNRNRKPEWELELLRAHIFGYSTRFNSLRSTTRDYCMANEKSYIRIKNIDSVICYMQFRIATVYSSVVRRQVTHFPRDQRILNWKKSTLPQFDCGLRTISGSCMLIDPDQISRTTFGTSIADFRT